MEEEKQRELENLLFGSLYNPVTFFGDEEVDHGSALFHVDRSAVSHNPDHDDDDDYEEIDHSEGVRKGEAAWEDEEEKEININIASVNRQVDFMKFNHDAQILAIGSKMKEKSVKLVHVPSLAVFSNWPPTERKMKYPRCLDFIPGSGFMAMGNAEGEVLLYQQNHYKNA